MVPPPPFPREIIATPGADTLNATLVHLCAAVDGLPTLDPVKIDIHRLNRLFYEQRTDLDNLRTALQILEKNSKQNDPVAQFGGGGGGNVASREPPAQNLVVRLQRQVRDLSGGVDAAKLLDKKDSEIMRLHTASREKSKEIDLLSTKLANLIKAMEAKVAADKQAASGANLHPLAERIKVEEVDVPWVPTQSLEGDATRNETMLQDMPTGTLQNQINEYQKDPVLAVPRRSTPVCENCAGDFSLRCDGRPTCGSCYQKSLPCRYTRCPTGLGCDSSICRHMHGDQWSRFHHTAPLPLSTIDDLPSDTLNNPQQQPFAKQPLFRFTLPTPTKSQPQVNPALLSDIGKPENVAMRRALLVGQERSGIKLEGFDRSDLWNRGWSSPDLGFPALNHPSLRSESPVHIGAASLSSSTKGLPSHVNKIPRPKFSLAAWRLADMAVDDELDVHAIAPNDGRQSDSHMTSHGEDTNEPSALDPVQTTGQSEQSDTCMASLEEDTNEPAALDAVQTTGQSEVDADHPMPNDGRQSDTHMASHEEDTNKPSALDPVQTTGQSEQSDTCMASLEEDTNEPSALEPVQTTGQSEVDEDHAMVGAEEILEDGEVV